MSEPDKPVLGRPPLDDAERLARLRERYPGILERLGEESDVRIARSYDISRALVGKIRKEWNIAAYQGDDFGPFPTVRWDEDHNQAVFSSRNTFKWWMVTRPDDNADLVQATAVSATMTDPTTTRLHVTKAHRTISVPAWQVWRRCEDYPPPLEVVDAVETTGACRRGVVTVYAAGDYMVRQVGVHSVEWWRPGQPADD